MNSRDPRRPDMAKFGASWDDLGHRLATTLHDPTAPNDTNQGRGGRRGR